MAKIKGIVFDVDQTLTTEVSWTKFTRLLRASEQTHIDIYEKFKAGDLTITEAKQQLVALWLATGKADLTSIKKIFASFEFSPNTELIIAYLKSKGYKLCLISGSMDTYVEIVSNRLGILDWYAYTKLHFDKNNLICDFDYKLSRGEEKLGFFADFCQKYDLKPEECAAIGDGDSDMPIFEKVALPILYICPETYPEQLEKIPNQIVDLIDLKNYL